MDASILLVGGDDFLSTLLDRTRNLVACTVEAAVEIGDAMSLIQAQQPDVVIFERSQAASFDLCRRVKDQARLAWIYCIVLDLAGIAADKAPWEHQLDQARRAEALDKGADAYLCLPLGLDLKHSLAHEEGDRVLRSQLLAGLRMVRTHRELMRTNDILSAIARLIH